MNGFFKGCLIALIFLVMIAWGVFAMFGSPILMMHSSSVGVVLLIVSDVAYVVASMFMTPWLRTQTEEA